MGKAPERTHTHTQPHSNAMAGEGGRNGVGAVRGVTVEVEEERRRQEKWYGDEMVG